MKTLNLIAIGFVALCGLAGIIFYMSLINIPVGMTGVRTHEYEVFDKKGVAQEDFGPGWHRDLGPLDSWVMFDSTVQTLEMTRESGRGDRQGRDDIRVQSADGYAVSVDVTIKYRIQPGSAHKVYQDTGSGVKYKTIVRSEVEKACMAIFGQMKTEEFYNPAERRKRRVEAQSALQASLSDNYIEVIDVLIRDVQFDPEYEKKIQGKKLHDQEVEFNKSLKAAEEMSGKTQVINAETERLVKIIEKEKQAELIKMQAETNRQIAKIRADFERYSTEKRADADLIAAQKNAGGTLLVETAKAEGEKLRNKAMLGSGGSVMVALEAARNINLHDVTVSTVEVDLLDIDTMVEKLGLPKGR